MLFLIIIIIIVPISALVVTPHFSFVSRLWDTGRAAAIVAGIAGIASSKTR